MFFSAPTKILCAEETSPERRKKQEHKKYAYKKDQDDITWYPPYDIIYHWEEELKGNP